MQRRRREGNAREISVSLLLSWSGRMHSRVSRVSLALSVCILSLIRTLSLPRPSLSGLACVAPAQRHVTHTFTSADSRLFDTSEIVPGRASPPPPPATTAAPHHLTNYSYAVYESAFGEPCKFCRYVQTSRRGGRVVRPTRIHFRDAYYFLFMPFVYWPFF